MDVGTDADSLKFLEAELNHLDDENFVTIVDFNSDVDEDTCKSALLEKWHWLDLWPITMLWKLLLTIHTIH